MSANPDDDDVDRTLRLMKELAAVREKLADTQRRALKPRTTRPEVADARTPSLLVTQRPPAK